MNVKTIAFTTILLSAIPAFAGTTAPSLIKPAPVATSASWHCKGVLYGWAEALDGDATLRGNNYPVDLGFDDVFDNLNFAVMGALEVGYNRWSFLADMSYAELSGSRDTRLTTIDAVIDQFIGNFVVAYNMIDTAPTRCDVYAGVRVNSLDLDLDVKTQNRTLSASGSETWVDPIIGVRFQQELPNQFFFRGVADVGGFGVTSDFTWQALATFGYHINDCGSVLLGYRGIGTDYTDGDFGYDVINHGVVLGFEYRF